MKVLDKKILTEEEVKAMESINNINISPEPVEEEEKIGEPDESFLITDKLKRLNSIRNSEVYTITVTLENKVTLDGDEKSQERISRAINTLDAKETTYWIDASGEPQELTREDLKDALKKAGQKQTEIFVEYAQKKADLMTA